MNINPVFNFNRQLLAIYKSFHCNKIPLTSATAHSRNFCYYYDESKFGESAPRKNVIIKSKSENDSQSKTSSVETSKTKTKSLKVADEAEPTWELGAMKFVTLNYFKGRTYLDIREYYEKDGKMFPGKKGISLNVEQWQKLCSSIDEINQVLKK